MTMCLLLTPPLLLLALMSWPEPVLGQDSYWTKVCEGEGGGGYVAGQILTRFTDNTGIVTMVMDNTDGPVKVRCTGSLGDPRIHVEEQDKTPPWYGTDSSKRPNNTTARASVNLTLWNQSFTTFWKSELMVKCNPGRRGCSMRLVEGKRGDWVKGNCTLGGGGRKVLNCNIDEWVQTAISHKGASVCAGQGEFQPHYQYSFRNVGAENWTRCSEWSDLSNREVEHRDERVTHLKCDVTGQRDHHFLVKMEKTHQTKAAVGLSFLAKPACKEASYFWVKPDMEPRNYVKFGSTKFWAVAGTGIVLFACLLLTLGVICYRKHFYKARYCHQISLQMSLKDRDDSEQGRPLSHFERSNSGFESNYNNSTDAFIKTSLATSSPEEARTVASRGQLNPSLPITSMVHLLPDLDPRMEIPRDQIKLGYYLGQGQFGTVYEGNVTGLLGEAGDKVVKVAVKEIKDTRAEGWADELKILSNLDMHLSLVNLLGACTCEPSLPTYILLEYCTFGDLKKFLCKHKDEFESRLKAVPGNYSSPYTATLLLRWSYSIARGMEYLATMKIMHGDLAARNVMVGENYTAKISDFGLSKVIPYYNEDYKKTQRKLIPWAWMATEYLKTGDFNIKSDVWSFGVVLWEIFTVGNRPYGINPDYEAEKLKILGGERLPEPELAELMPWGREVYREVITPCWQDEARQRPDFPSLVAKLGELLGEGEVGQYEEQSRVYRERQEERSRAPQPPVRMDSLREGGESEVCEGCEGYVAMEEVTSGAPSRDPGYSRAVSFNAATAVSGYIGLQEVGKT